jgi:hypothetical protein
MNKDLVCCGCDIKCSPEYTVCNICDFLLCQKCKNSTSNQYFVAHKSKDNVHWYTCTRCEYIVY